MCTYLHLALIKVIAPGLIAHDANQDGIYHRKIYMLEKMQLSTYLSRNATLFSFYDYGKIWISASASSHKFFLDEAKLKMKVSLYLKSHKSQYFLL